MIHEHFGSYNKTKHLHNHFQLELIESTRDILLFCQEKLPYFYQRNFPSDCVANRDYPIFIQVCMALNVIPCNISIARIFYVKTKLCMNKLSRICSTRFCKYISIAIFNSKKRFSCNIPCQPSWRISGSIRRSVLVIISFTVIKTILVSFIVAILLYNIGGGFHSSANVITLVKTIGEISRTQSKC